jgi:hypothetical protein
MVGQVFQTPFAHTGPNGTLQGVMYVFKVYEPGELESTNYYINPMTPIRNYSTYGGPDCCPQVCGGGNDEFTYEDTIYASFEQGSAYFNNQYSPGPEGMNGGCSSNTGPNCRVDIAAGEAPEAPTCAQIEAENCDNPSLSMIQPCVTIDGQVPDQSYVNTAIAANNTSYLINSVSPSTSAPYGTVDLPQTGVQGCPGEGTLGIETGGVGFNYPQGWDSGDWTATFVDMILNHPNPCNFLQNQFGNFLNQLFAGADGPVNFDINGNITPPGAAAVGVLQANLLMQKLVVIYELMGMTGCGPQNLEEQNVDKSSVKNIKMDPKAKAVLRKSAGKLKGLANKKADPAVDRMQKLAGIPKDKPMDKPRKM